jgi:hypothetical protein
MGSLFGCEPGDDESSGTQAEADPCTYISTGPCAEGGTGTGTNVNTDDPGNPIEQGAAGQDTPDGGQIGAEGTLDPTKPENWVDILKGRHVQVYYSASEGESSSTGSVYIIGGETFDLFLCSDMTLTGKYKDTTCVSVYVPNDAGDGNNSDSNCDGDYEEQEGSGTWKVEMLQNNVPALVVTVSGMETLYFALGSDGNYLFVDGIQAVLEDNPHCE